MSALILPEGVKQSRLISDDYRKQQEQMHRNSDYGVASQFYAPIVAQAMNRFGVQEVLDYGAGKGRLGQTLMRDRMVKHAFRLQHYDPAVPEWSAEPTPCEPVAEVDGFGQEVEAGRRLVAPEAGEFVAQALRAEHAAGEGQQAAQFAEAEALVQRAVDAEAGGAGDALQAMAFELVAHEATHPDPFVRAELALELARAIGPAGMVGGQMMDIVAESADFDLPSVARLQQLKTGALIAFSLEAGAILGRVPPEGRHGLRGYAHDIGLAFQIADDVLDAEGNAALAGKALQKDAKAGKATFLSLMGIDRAKAQMAMLVEQAIAHLHGFGAEADLLRAVARYTVERDR